MAMDPSDGEVEMARAIKTMDISDIPEIVKRERSEELAVKLYAVLDHIGFTPGKAPSSTTLDALQLTQVGGTALYMERSGPNWRFSKVTVNDIPTIFREIEPQISKRDMRELADATNTWLTIRTYVPEALKGKTLLIEDWQWVAGILALFGLFLIHRTLLYLFRLFIVAALAPRLGLPPTLNLRPLGRPLAFVVLTTALQIFLLTIDLPMDVHTTVVEWISTVRIVALVVLGIYLVDIFGERLSHRASRTPSTVDDILYPLVQKALWLIVVLAGIAQILSVHGVNVSGLVAGLGLGGLAFALAAKDTVENIFGSVAILIDQPFRVGDAINVGGVSGTVEQIGLRSTRLRTPENSLISMPNSKVIAGHVDNLGARQFFRSRVTLNIAYDTPIQSVEALCVGIRELLASHPLCKKDAVAVYIHDLQPSGITLLIQFHLNVRDWAVEQSTREKIFIAILTLIQTLRIRLTAPPQEIKVAQTVDTTSSEQETVSVEKATEAARAIATGWKGS
jgi:MscS family membrane protein